MKIRNLIIAAATLAIAAPALATVKVYDGTIDNGISSENVGYTTSLCPPVKGTPGSVQGFQTITDTGGGTVTLVTNSQPINYVDIVPPALIAVFGPGSFVFVNSRATWSTALPVVASGDTTPSTGSIAWGEISGWQTTGQTFCIASPQTICTGGTMVPHGITSNTPAANSPTYDLGTWTFDAEGDLTASSYITGTNNGGTSNRQRIIRGAYVGSSIPALPLLGAAALALGFLAVGTRSLLRKK